MIFVSTNNQKRERNRDKGEGEREKRERGRERKIERDQEREREKDLHAFVIVHVLFACVSKGYLLKPTQVTACIFQELITHVVSIKENPRATKKDKYR